MSLRCYHHLNIPHKKLLLHKGVYYNDKWCYLRYGRTYA